MNRKLARLKEKLKALPTIIRGRIAEAAQYGAALGRELAEKTIPDKKKGGEQ